LRPDGRQKRFHTASGTRSRPICPHRAAAVVGVRRPSVEREALGAARRRSRSFYQVINTAAVAYWTEARAKLRLPCQTRSAIRGWSRTGGCFIRLATSRNRVASTASRCAAG